MSSCLRCRAIKIVLVKTQFAHRKKNKAMTQSCALTYSHTPGLPPLAQGGAKGSSACRCSEGIYFIGFRFGVLCTVSAWCCYEQSVVTQTFFCVVFFLLLPGLPVVFWVLVRFIRNMCTFLGESTLNPCRLVMRATTSPMSPMHLGTLRPW